MGHEFIPTLRQANLQTLMEMVDEGGDDVLGFRDYGGDVYAPESEKLELLSDLASDALSGRQEGVMRRLAEWPALRKMDVVTATLLAHLGIDAASALILSDALGKTGKIIQIVGRDNDYATLPDAVRVTGSEMKWTTAMGGGVSWGSTGVVRTPPLPETVASAMVGKSLRTIVSHPVLDAYDFVVTCAQVADEWTSIDVASVENEACTFLNADELKGRRKARKTA